MSIACDVTSLVCLECAEAVVLGYNYMIDPFLTALGKKKSDLTNVHTLHFHSRYHSD